MAPDRTTRLALAAVKWIGSTASIAVHTALFILCFLAIAVGWIGFNEMLLALTTVVSLEAIYLALFIQLTVNHQSQSIAAVEKDIDEMQEDVGEIQEDIDELQEDVEEIEESDDEDERRDREHQQSLSSIQNDLKKLMDHIDKLRNPPR